MLRIISYNLLTGFQDRPERKAAALAWIAAKAPDVLALQEMNGYTPAKLAHEAQQWGHSFSLLLKTEGYAPALSSRLPFEHVARVLEGFQHGLLSACNGALEIFVLHLSVLGWEKRLQEAAQVIVRAKRAVQDGRQALILGDFNALSALDAQYYDSEPGVLESQRACDRKFGWSGTRNGELDFGVMESFAAAGFVDIVAQKTSAVRKRLTYPTPLLEAEPESGSHLRRGVRLDYVLASPQLAERCVRANVENDGVTSMLSDHYPVVAEFDI
jgi:exodeoxyribonuclease-3